MARLYETVVLVDANREDAAIEASVQKFQDIIAAGGEVIRADRWGKRRIAYDIAGNSHADYTVFYYHATKNTLVAELERMLIHLSGKTEQLVTVVTGFEQFSNNIVRENSEERFAPLLPFILRTFTHDGSNNLDRFLNHDCRSFFVAAFVPSVLASRKVVKQFPICRNRE